MQPFTQEIIAGRGASPFQSGSARISRGEMLSQVFERLNTADACSASSILHLRLCEDSILRTTSRAFRICVDIVFVRTMFRSIVLALTMLDSLKLQSLLYEAAVDSIGVFTRGAHTT